MTKKYLHSILALVFAWQTSTANITSAQTKTDYNEVAQVVTTMFAKLHYTKKNMDEDLSEKVFYSYLELLDPRHYYFTQEDVDYLHTKYARSLHEIIDSEKGISAAKEIYQLYLKRVKNRIEKINKILDEQQFTFDSDKVVKLKREDPVWPQNMESTDELWLRLLENDILEEELSKEAEKKILTKNKKILETYDLISSLEKNSENYGREFLDLNNKWNDLIDDYESTIFMLKNNRDDLHDIFSYIDNKYKNEDESEDTIEKIKKQYHYTLTQAEIRNTEAEIAKIFLNGIAYAYDPHSEYLNPNDKESFDIEMQNQLEGIGALLSTSIEDGSAEISGLIKGGPAYKSGQIKIKDKIVAVGQGDEEELVSIIGMSLGKAVSLIRGKRGTKVNLKIKREVINGLIETKIVTITRDKIDIKDDIAYSDLIEYNPKKSNPNSPKQKIGWIKVGSFYADMRGFSNKGVSDDVELLVKKLMKENVNGIILDMRSNPGGSLDQAIKMTGLFIPRGPVVQQRYFQDQVKVSSSYEEKPLYNGPLVVLVDRMSASASEIVAAALQDHKRAIIIGNQSTFGKGTVQMFNSIDNYMSITNFPNLFQKKPRAGELKITIQKFYRIAGGTTQLVGVIPDIILPSIYDAYEIGEKYKKNALKYDTIAKNDYKLFNQNLFIEELKEKSQQRVAKNKDFQYIIDDIKKRKEKLESGLEVSLNKETRLEEQKNAENKREQKLKEIKKRYAKIAKDEKDLIKIFRITLDNINDKELTEAKKIDFFNRTGRIVQDDDKTNELDSVKPVHNLDAFEREALEIMHDYIEFNKNKNNIDPNSITLRKN